MLRDEGAPDLPPLGPGRVVGPRKPRLTRLTRLRRVGCRQDARARHHPANRQLEGRCRHEEERQEIKLTSAKQRGAARPQAPGRRWDHDGVKDAAPAFGFHEEALAFIAAAAGARAICRYPCTAPAPPPGRRRPLRCAFQARSRYCASRRASFSRLLAPPDAALLLGACLVGLRLALEPLVLGLAFLPTPAVSGASKREPASQTPFAPGPMSTSHGMPATSDPSVRPCVCFQRRLGKRIATDPHTPDRPQRIDIHPPPRRTPPSTPRQHRQRS